MMVSSPSFTDSERCFMTTLTLKNHVFLSQSDKIAKKCDVISVNVDTVSPLRALLGTRRVWGSSD